MENNLLVLSAIFVPTLGSVLLIPAGMVSERIRNALSFIFILTSLVCSALLLSGALNGEVTTVHYQLPLGFNFSLACDRLAVFMAIVSSLISSIIVFYSFGYIKHYENRNEYYFLVTLFLGSMMGIVYSANLIFLYLFWEITAITSWRLIGYFREKDYVLKADKSFLVTFFGAVLMFIGFVMIYEQTGSFDYSAISESLKSSNISNLAVILILAGILSKSATLPFHTWLPDAGVAPSPVTALLHAAVLVKIGVYVYARLFISLLPTAPFWHTVVPAIAAVSAIVSAGAALIDNDIKRIIAYSTISQIGFIFLGLATSNEICIAGGLLFILMHGLAKAGLFLCAGIIEQSTHTKDITKLGGLIHSMPITAVSFLFCAFSVMGIPPFGGFWSKYMVISGSAAGGSLWITIAFVAGAFLTLIYLMRLFALVFLGEVKTQPHGEGSATMLTSVSLLAVLSLIAGIGINAILGPVQLIVFQMLKQ